MFSAAKNRDGGRRRSPQGPSPLYGDDLRGYLISQHVSANLEGHIAQAVRDAQAYRSALGGWRTCMTHRGFSFATPQAARQGAGTAARKGGRAAEIRVATADAEGGRDHRLLAIGVAQEQARFADSGPELTGWTREFRSRRLAALPEAGQLVRAESRSRGQGDDAGSPTIAAATDTTPLATDQPVGPVRTKRQNGWPAGSHNTRTSA
ncbi:hypothetical protein [Streptomyces canus]|uniref:hypothetical protein n=1 Tax=Streptomyces canus TaxID=58343 RepID=UPI0036E2AED2